MEIVLSRILCMWMLFVFLCIGLLYNNMDDKMHLFFKFGPNNTFYIIGININNYEKYLCVAFYCFANSIARCVMINLLQPWLINQVQDKSKEKTSAITLTAYQINSVVKIYAWVDWFIYMKLLFSQIDIFIIEIGADVIVSNIAVYYYLRNKSEINNEMHLIIDSV